jgi:hypothetical protein
MTIEQCARELADLLQSGQPPSPQQVNALIHSCLQRGRRETDGYEIGISLPWRSRR